jgi:hypothetical protein
LPNAHVRARMGGYPTGGPHGEVEVAAWLTTRSLAHRRCAVTGSHAASMVAATAGASGSRAALPKVSAKGARVLARPAGRVGTFHHVILYSQNTVHLMSASISV